jgi:hypothetical protein
MKKVQEEGGDEAPRTYQQYYYKKFSSVLNILTTQIYTRTQFAKDKIFLQTRLKKIKLTYI